MAKVKQSVRNIISNTDRADHLRRGVLLSAMWQKNLKVVNCLTPSNRIFCVVVIVFLSVPTFLLIFTDMSKPSVWHHWL